MGIMNPLLYGKDDEEKIVAIEKLNSEHVNVYRREGSNVTTTEERYWPFFFTSKEVERHLKGVKFRKKDLTGKGKFNRLIYFPNDDDYRKLIDLLDSNDYYSFRSRPEMYMLQTGKTLFKGMALNDLYRMQIDIEVISPNGNFPSAKRKEDEIVIIAMSDNKGWRKILYSHPNLEMNDPLYQRSKNERLLLRSMIREIHKRNPDVIEGHNIFGFDLPYLRDRAKKIHQVPLVIGRNNREPLSYPSSKKFAEKNIDYDVFKIGGRHVIDTMFLAFDYDVYKRDFSSYGLKYLAKYFGCDAPDREYVEGHRITEVWQENPKRLLKYALDDVLETQCIANILSQATFALTQMLPISYSAVHRAGKSILIEKLFIREYLRQLQAIPTPESGRQQYGGYTDIFKRGVFDNQMYLDVKSLYPSIMLNYNIQPKSDDLGLFQKLLQLLTDLRLKTKKEMYEVGKGNDGYDLLDAQQNSYKTLINSFYGMAGFPDYASFNDIREADRVARTGQKTLRVMISIIRKLGGEPTLADTDGVLTSIPYGMTADELTNKVNDCIEKYTRGIEIENDGEFDRVLAYKKKNYVLRSKDGSIKLKGNSLKGRRMEKFARDYINDILMTFLEKRYDDLGSIHRSYIQRIVNKEWELEDFLRKATIHETIEEYEKGVETNENKNRSAPYELAKEIQADGLSVHVGDYVRFYVAGDELRSNVRVFRDAKLVKEYNNDENIHYYLKRIDDIAKRFEILCEAMGLDFGTIFVRTLTYLKEMEE